MSIQFPGGIVPIDSPFYIDRPPIEKLANSQILKPGSVVRIQAPRKMGKSSLLLRMISFAQKQNYRTVTINFMEAEEAILANLNQLLRWFCANIARQLKLKPMIDEYWDEDMGSKVSCSIYFQSYLLQKIQSPLLLTLNEVNRVFEYPSVAKDFLPLLRAWHEQAKLVKVFQKLRLVVVHCTEVYVPLNINQSPFNVGLPFKLPEFNLTQVRDLALRYGLDWRKGKEVEELMALVGGHPYLLQIAFYYLSQQQVTLENLLEQAHTQAGIYSRHLRGHWEQLQKHPPLAAAIKQVVTADESLQLEPLIAYRLNSMGLVKLDGDRAYPSCQLYRLYFSQQNLERPDSHSSLDKLRQENQHLKNLVYIDSLTKIPNRRCFDNYLKKEWGRMARNQTVLSLILLDIDCFKLYNDRYGHPAGDICLKKVAAAMENCLKRDADLAARYGGEEFAAILPETDLEGAIRVAKQMQETIKALAIEHENSIVRSKIISVSIGIASIIPHPQEDPAILIKAADRELYHSKIQGRDRLNVRYLSGERSR